MRRAVLVSLVPIVVASTAHADETEKTAWRSPPLVAGGITAISVGAGAVGLGSYFVAMGSRTTVLPVGCYGCKAPVVELDPKLVVGGAVTIALGALSVLAGIPMIYVGARHTRVWLTANGIAGQF